jgi:hypothetical protein
LKFTYCLTKGMVFCYKQSRKLFKWRCVSFVWPIPTKRPTISLRSNRAMHCSACCCYVWHNYLKSILRYKFLIFYAYNPGAIPVVARCKAWGCKRSLAGVAVSILAGAWMSLVSVVYCQVQVCASGWSVVQRCPTECGVYEFDREASIMRRSWPIRGCLAIKKSRHYIYVSQDMWVRGYISKPKRVHEQSSLGNAGLHEFQPWSSCKLTT